MKDTGMPVVSLRGVLYGFWSHLGIHDRTQIFLDVKVSFMVVRKEIKKTSHCVGDLDQSAIKMVSFRIQRKLEPRPDWCT